MALALQAVREAFTDHYVVERALGRGGMSTVFLARDLRATRDVALKVLQPEVAVAVGAARFRREIEILSRLDHPNILPLLDSGQAGVFVYYAMPFAEGGTLAQRLSATPRLSLADTLEIAEQIAAALDHAHTRHIVHRDIKPDNIMFDRGRALIADFGVARALERAAGDRISSSGIIIGTPAYMSPEQARGAAVDHRTDIYALACVVFEMLTGEPPFSGHSAQIIMSRHVREAPPAIRVVRPDLPSHVDRALQAALAKDRLIRPRTARALHEALSQTA